MRGFSLSGPLGVWNEWEYTREGGWNVATFIRYYKYVFLLYTSSTEPSSEVAHTTDLFQALDALSHTSFQWWEQYTLLS